MPVIAGVYTRLSVAKDSTEVTTDAIDRQLDRCRALAKAKGWRVVEHYSDVDVGAYRAPGRRRPPAREHFERMLADVEAGRIRGIVFFKLDRLVRDHGDFERVMATCETHGAVLACVVDAIDTSTPTGEAMARTMVTFARLESQTTALRVSARKEQAAREGLPAVSAWRPFGFDQRGLELVEPEAEALRVAARRILDGWSLNEVTQVLNDAGMVGTTGARWNTTRLKKVLCSPRIAGLRSYKGQVVSKGKWPAILDEQTWNRVVAVLNDPTRGTGRPGRPAKWLLAGGLARCGHGDCGAPLMVKPAGQGQNPRYVCDNRPGRPGCGKIAVSAPRLEDLVGEMVLARDWRHLDTRAAHGQAEGELEEQLAAARIRVTEIARMHARRRITTEEWLVQRDELASYVAELSEQLEEARRRAAGADLPSSGEGLRAWWESEETTLEQRRALLRRVLVAVFVKPATRRGIRTLDPDRVDPVWRA